MATTSTSRCWSTGWRRSASRASPSTSPTASSPRRSASSSSPTRRATSSTPGTWRPAPRRPTSRSCWSMPGKGVLVQTRRHSIIASLLGIRHVVLAVNKIDLVGFDEQVFETIKADYATFAQSLGFKSMTPIPMSARFGDNVTRAFGQDAVVFRADAAGASGDDRRRHRCAGRAVPLPGAVCQPAQPGLPRLCRHHRLGLGRGRRRGDRRQVGQGVAGEAHRHPWRRPGAGRRRAGGHHRAGGRGRGVARQHAGGAAGEAQCRRPVRGQCRVVRRARHAARPLLHPAHRDRPGQRHDHAAEAPHRRQQLGRAVGAAAGA